MRTSSVQGANGQYYNERKPYVTQKELFHMNDSSNQNQQQRKQKKKKQTAVTSLFNQSAANNSLLTIQGTTNVPQLQNAMLERSHEIKSLTSQQKRIHTYRTSI